LTHLAKSLVAQGKAFDVSELTAKALLHNLDQKDYGRPLDELRDLFWSSPRFPLLPAGELDLQRAIFEAVGGSMLRLVGADDLDRVVTRPGDIAVGSPGLRLAPPEPVEALDDTGTTDSTTGGSSDSTSSKSGAPAGGQPGGRQAAPMTPSLLEREIAFTLMTSMSEPGTRDAVRRLLLDLSNAADEGHISWAQIQVKVVVAEEVGAAIEQDVRDSGSNPSSRPA